jgi:hypothetical protein
MTSQALSFEEFKRVVVPVFRAVFRNVDSFGEPFQEAAACRLILHPVKYLLGDMEIDAVAAAASAVGDPGFYVVETENYFHWRELLEDPPDVSPPHSYTWVKRSWARLVPSRLLRGGLGMVKRVEVAPEYADNPAWYFSLDDLQPWKDGRYPGNTLETALISSTGRWGVLISHEDHAVVGGAQTFVETLAAEFPSLPGFDRQNDEGEWVEGELLPPSEQVLSFLEGATIYSPDPMHWLPTHLAHIYGPDKANDLLRRAGFTT